MTDAQVRDEAVILFLAGHETTALALTYALYLLATHPEAQVRLADEIDRVLGGRSPGLGDLDKLAVTETVVLESMRLYPPAWGIGRQAHEPVEIGGYAFPKGAEFVMSPWVVHRDARNFEDADAFKPERWEGDLQRRLPSFAYFPFGGGPRVCIGNRFAMMEAKLVLASAVQRFRFEPHARDGGPPLSQRHAAPTRRRPVANRRPPDERQEHISKIAAHPRFARERLAGERRERQAGADCVDVVAG